MTDIVLWLRAFRMSTTCSDWNANVVNIRLDEAANEIERLRKDNEVLSTMVVNMVAKEFEHVVVYKSEVGI